MDEVAEVSDELMEHYLEGQEISHEECVSALKAGVTAGTIFPVTCGAATRNLGSDRLLDALVEDLPSPGKVGAVHAGQDTLEPTEDGEMVAFVFKTLADTFAGRINLFRVYQGVMKHDSQVQNCRTHHKERIGQLLVPQGKEYDQADEFGPGDIGAVAKLKETHAGDVLAEKDGEWDLKMPDLPRPVMAFAMEPKAKGDEEKAFAALRRLQEEDPTIDVHRDRQTGEEIVAGLTQIHVEVIVDRMKERFGAEVNLKPPRVPYHETIRGPAKAHGRYKKQTGGRGQFGDCQIEIEPLPSGSGFEFVNKIKGGVIPSGFIPAVEKGIVETMAHGVIAGYPVEGVRVTLYDGSYHSVDSSEMAFKVAGSMAFKEAMEKAKPVLLEPIMTIAVTRARGLRWRRDRRPQLPPRAAARHGAQGRRHRGPGRGADGRDPQLRARPAPDHRRTGRLHDGAGALRGGAVAPRGQGGRERERTRPLQAESLKGGEHAPFATP